MAKPTDLDLWISQSAKTRCRTCSDCAPEMLDDIARFAAGLEEHRITMTSFHSGYLVPRGYRLSVDALGNHIARCVRRTDGK